MTESTKPSPKVSSCCQANVRVDCADEGTCCHVCIKCNKPCDAISDEGLSEKSKNFKGISEKPLTDKGEQNQQSKCECICHMSPQPILGMKQERTYRIACEHCPSNQEKEEIKNPDPTKWCDCGDEIGREGANGQCWVCKDIQPNKADPKEKKKCEHSRLEGSSICYHCGKNMVAVDLLGDNYLYLALKAFILGEFQPRKAEATLGVINNCFQIIAQESKEEGRREQKEKDAEIIINELVNFSDEPAFQATLELTKRKILNS